MATAKKVKPKRVKVEKVRLSHPARGKGGRFVSSSRLRGTEQFKTTLDTMREQGFEVARKHIRRVAELFREELVERIQNQNVMRMGGAAHGRPRRFDTPLHPFTLYEKREKGQDLRTMIASGEYLNSIQVLETRVGKGRYTYTVGIPADAQHSSGIAMRRLQRIQEYGAVIPVTPKMRAYLHYRGLHLRKDTNQIVIPARPHWMPTWMHFRRQYKGLAKWASKELTKELAQILRSLR
jgi:hypothetical protein